MLVLPAPPLAKKAGSTAPSQPTLLGKLPTGKDFVRSSAKKIPGEPSRRRVLLEISDGWHVNANPASLDFLIPTNVALTNPASGAPELVAVVYPNGTEFSPRFSLEPLVVYEGNVSIDVELPTKLSPDAWLELTFQACDDTTCLPPQTVPLLIP